MNTIFERNGCPACKEKRAKTKIERVRDFIQSERALVGPPTRVHRKLPIPGDLFVSAVKASITGELAVFGRSAVLAL